MESVRVSAGPNGPWHTVDAQENVGVLQDLGQRLILVFQFILTLRIQKKKKKTVRPSRFFAYEGNTTIFFLALCVGN